jgi:DNA-binding SARP family transcriptional activator
MLRLRLVGEVAADVDGESRALPPGRPRALLAWLALRPGVHPRTAVASAFWPDVLDESARASLRSALWTLRRALGDEALVSTRERVGLAPDTWVDVLEAERLRGEGRYDEALALCEGALLPGVEDEWALEAQDEHRERVVSLLEELAAAAAESGDIRCAVTLTRRQAALEPLSEEIHRALMSRLDAAGDRGAALAEYAELRSRLVTRLHTGPSQETQALADALRTGRASTPSPFPVRLLRADRAAFVGRETELARIDTAWGRVVSGGGAAQVVLLAGEAGIGKSRLAARFAAEAGAAGATVLYGACEEQSLVPYEPFSEAIGDRAPERHEIEERLIAATAIGPLVLVLDDLHLADRNTLALLARVARGAAGERLLVLGAYRDADAVGTPLLAAIADLRRDCDVERVALEGLSVDEVAALLDGTADARRIHDRTDGNPFFVRELTRHLAERRDAGAVPESVSDVVLARVARLSARSAEALAQASVLGESFDLAPLEQLVAQDDLLDALDEAAAAGLLEDGAGGRYRFSHALTRDAVYGSIGPGRRADLHRRAAAALERVHGLESGPELGAIALHLCEGASTEDRPRAVELAERAATWAGERDGWEQVVTLLTRALSLLEDKDVERRRRLTRTRAIAYARLTHALVDV